MFDLDQQIDRWKSAFAKKAACSSDELLELESHLREDIAALVAEGRSEQEAFCESVSRLGDATEICGEFANDIAIPLALILMRAFDALASPRQGTLRDSVRRRRGCLVSGWSICGDRALGLTPTASALPSQCYRGPE